ncbi:hypothetical protein [Halobacterium sp. R2-5]|uniref:hypothetical protein n=1 Tax=Halobacterium sp. R2-5 TaxID=2715751 RepID=UPI001AAF04AC|nr:hypothetical protein [Halobacterium sp. R2-5]
MVDDPTIPLGDIRQEDPGSDRQAAFKRGWTAAVKDLGDSDNTSKYGEGPPPEELTWDNLGYRLGSLFGETDDDLRQELFEWCVKKQNRELQRREPSQGHEQARTSSTERLEASAFGIGCEYCPHAIQSVTIPEEAAEKLQDRTIPPTHVEIECPKCENDFYYTQDRWYFASDDKGVFSVPERETRKTSPGENVYVPKEEVVKVE